MSNYIKLNKSIFSSREFLSATPEQRGVWLMLYTEASKSKYKKGLITTNVEIFNKAGINFNLMKSCRLYRRIVGKGVQVNMFAEDKEKWTQAEEIYKEYPRKVAKPAALKAIVAALGKFSYESLLKATKEYAKARDDQENAFTPHPATWFNQERFCDSMDTWAPKKNDTTFNL